MKHPQYLQALEDVKKEIKKDLNRYEAVKGCEDLHEAFQRGEKRAIEIIRQLEK